MYKKPRTKNGMKTWGRASDPYKKKVPKKVKDYVNKAIDRNIEDKICIVSTSHGTHASPWVNQTFEVLSLNTNIVQGDDSKTRSGSEIKIKQLDITFEFYKEFDYANTEYRGFRPETSLRLFVINKRIPAGTHPDPTEMLIKSANQTYQSATTNEYFTKNYKIMMDKKIYFRNSEYMNYLPTANVNYYSIIKSLHKRIKFKRPLRIQYHANAGTVSDIIKNYLSIGYVWSGLDDTDSHFLPPGLNISCKMYFEDA